jgi:CheY-like chemotaxis protein
MRESATRGEMPTVLLIDDDLVSREVAATMLTFSGYTVYTATDGGAGLKEIEAGNCVPDVVLVDAQMPGLSGAELIGKLRACAGRVAVIAISGSEAPEEIAGAADGFLLKPFDAGALKKVLDQRPETHAGLAESRPGNGLTDWNDPVVSAETLAQLRSLMPEEGIREIYTSVAMDLRKRLTELDAAIARHDGAAVRSIGHAIKGGCGMAGALQAARLGALLEAVPADLPGNHLDNSAKLINDLRAAAQNLERILALELPV